MISTIRFAIFVGILPTVILAALAAFHLKPLRAHEGAMGVVKDRMELMKSVADHMKSLGAIFKGSVPHDEDKIKISAKAISDHADKIPSLFPEGSLKHPSEAKMEIWRSWDEFEKSAERLKVLAQALAETDSIETAQETSQVPGDGSDSVDKPTAMPPKTVFLEMAKTCKSCHESFRQKKN